MNPLLATRAFVVMAILPLVMLAQSALAQSSHNANGTNTNGSTESRGSTTEQILSSLIQKKKALTNDPPPDENASKAFILQWQQNKKNQTAVLDSAINALRSGLSSGQEQVVKSVFDGEAQARLKSDNSTLSVVKNQTTTTTTQSSETPRAFQPVTTGSSSSITSTTTTITSQRGTEIARTSVQDLTQSAKDEIAKDPTFATAAVIQSLNKNPSSGQRAAATSSATNNATAYNDTYSSVSSAAGGGGSSSGVSFSSYSPDMTAMWATMNQFNTNSYFDHATSYLGMKSGAYDLSSNPVYSTIKTAENSELFRQMALNSMRGKGDSANLVDLATKDGFQDSLKTAIGQEGQDDFNLLTAGAAITSNGDLDPAIVMQAQSYINSVLNSQNIINDSNALSSLNGALGGNGLALLSLETLYWLKYASDLAYADIGTLPSQMQNRRDIYLKGYKDLETFLKNLALGDAVALLNTLKVPVDLEKNAKLYQEAHQNFIKAHHEPIKFLKSKELKGKDEQRLLAFLERIAKWVVQVPRHDVKALGKWSKLMGEDSQGTVQHWEHLEPQSLTLARFFYAQMYYHAYVSTSFAASGKASDMIVLVGDAQSWANFELSQINERRQEKEKLEKSEKERPKKKSKQKFLDE